MDNNFAALGIPPFLSQRMAERNILEPTPIQRQVIPVLLRGESLVFRSATGTGKTFAYLLPVLKTLLQQEPGKGGPRCMIAAPTHELCSQIKQEADFLLAGTGHKAALLIGQTHTGRQIEALKKDKPLIAVGNPGRLQSLGEMNKLKFGSLEFLVLDEGDRLVSDELIEETAALVSFILKHKPPGAEGGLRNPDGFPVIISCSATFSQKNREKLFSLFGGRAGERIKLLETGENILKEQVEHWAFFSEEREKIETLRSFINAAFKKSKPGKAGAKALIFTARGRQVGNVVSKLQHYKINAAGLWGGMDKKARKKAMDDFRAGRARFLVTSDLAARGLDIPDIDYIIALDTGESRDSYIHRAGRTARAGKRGVMVTIGSESELRRLAALEKKLGIVVYPKELYGGRIRVPEE